MSGRDLARLSKARRYRVPLRVTCDYLPLEAQVAALIEGLDVDVTYVGKPAGGRQLIEVVGQANQLLVVLVRFTEYDVELARSLWGARELA